MTTLVPFSFESHQVRVLTDDNGEPMFVAKDVAEALGYANTSDAISTHCKGVAERYPLQTAGGTQQARVIREPDLYRLMAGSSLPSAQEFEKLLFEEILPAIRKTGRYEAKPSQKAEIRPRVVKEAFSAGLHIAKLCGFTGNQALLSADRCAREFTGRSALEVIGANHLLADARGRTYNPTELGKMLVEPMSAVKLNKLFEEKGLQVHDISGGWAPLEAAAGLYEWTDTGKRHSSGAPVKQIKWFVGVLDAIGIQYTLTGEAAA